MASVHLTREELCCRKNDLSNYRCKLYFAISPPKLSCAPGCRSSPQQHHHPQKIQSPLGCLVLQVTDHQMDISYQMGKLGQKGIKTSQPPLTPPII